jgi:hypothetical protein
MRPPQGLAGPIAKLGDLPQCAIRLDDYSATVLDKFSEEPPAMSVHIIVEPPFVGQ